MSFGAIIALEDGTILEGNGFGVKTIEVGEIVFNTSMTGYQEIITDPSYKDQIITFTNPHIGNTGINDEDNESDNKNESSKDFIEPKQNDINKRLDEKIADKEDKTVLIKQVNKYLYLYI